MPRRLRAHPGERRGGEGGGGKKGSSHSGEGEGGGGKLRIHRFALNQTKSEFLRVHVAMQPSKWAGKPRRPRTDISILSAFFFFFSPLSLRLYAQDGHAGAALVR